MNQSQRSLNTLAEGRYIRLVERDGWEWAQRVRGSAVVVIVPVTSEGELILTEQHRPAVDGRVIDLPAGLAGDEAHLSGERPAEAARRELIEETGYDAPELQWLTEGPSSAGLSDEILTFYLAGEARRVGPGGGDGNEDITVHVVPLPEVDQWLDDRHAQGQHVEPKVYAGLYFALRHLGRIANAAT